MKRSFIINKSLGGFEFSRLERPNIIKSRVVLPSLGRTRKNVLSPTKSNTNIVAPMVENHWKCVSSNSPLFKQYSINAAMKSRKQNVVLDLKRRLKNPYSYIDSQAEVDYSVFEERCRKLTLKLCKDNEANN